jgi:hypothetical protein
MGSGGQNPPKTGQCAAKWMHQTKRRIGHQMSYEAYLRREAAELDSYCRQQSHLHECEIAAALDEAERISARAEQNRIEGQLDLIWRTSP